MERDNQFVVFFLAIFQNIYSIHSAHNSFPAAKDILWFSFSKRCKLSKIDFTNECNGSKIKIVQGKQSDV